RLVRQNLDGRGPGDTAGPPFGSPPAATPLPGRTPAGGRGSSLAPTDRLAPLEACRSRERAIMMSAFTASQARIRRIARVVAGQPTSDGAGVKLTRLIGTEALPDLDPFLMLDAFGSDDPKAYIAGFPDHPHRGFETVTYMLAGRLRHRDNKGNSGL